MLNARSGHSCQFVESISGGKQVVVVGLTTAQIYDVKNDVWKQSAERSAPYVRYLYHIRHIENVS